MPLLDYMHSLTAVTICYESFSKASFDLFCSNYLTNRFYLSSIFICILGDIATINFAHYVIALENNQDGSSLYSKKYRFNSNFV